MRIGSRRQSSNDALRALESSNRESLKSIAQFRRRTAPGPEAFKEFSRLKHEHPYVGMVPCRAANIDFVIFHANDDIVAWEYLWFGDDAYEPETIATWVDWCRRPNQSVYDIGGYSGLMSILAAMAHESNRVHLFEPMDRTIERAKINIRANRVGPQVRLHNVAASDTAGPAEINLYREENFLGTGNSVYDKGLPVKDVKTIRCVRIDDELDAIAPTVVKIDVEGHELAVLAGMAKTITRARPKMIVEVWEHDRSSVLDMLTSLDYSCTPFGDPDRRVVNYACLPRTD